MKKNSFNNTKGCNLYNINSTFVSPTYTFSLAGNIIVYKPIPGTNRDKYFTHLFYKGLIPTLAAIKDLSVLFLFHRPRLFHLPAKKCTGLMR